jgi:hypothetical protein
MFKVQEHMEVICIRRHVGTAVAGAVAGKGRRVGLSRTTDQAQAGWQFDF